MNPIDDLELRLHAWMTATAPEREPAGMVGRAIAATERAGQRPRLLATGLGRPNLGGAAPSLAIRLVLVALVVAAALAYAVLDLVDMEIVKRKRRG